MHDLKEDVEFMMVAEMGVLETQAILLCESIRQFGGRYANCPIAVVSPRAERRPSPATARRLDQLGADYLTVEISSCAPEYGTSYRVHSAAYVENRPGPPIVVQLDSDTVFLSEPDFSLAGLSAAARPVDVKGMCTTGPGDAFETYWKSLCAILSVEYERIPTLVTTVDRQTVRASYNGGLLVTRRAAGLFARTEDLFKRIVAARLQPWPDGPLLRTGTGFLSGAQTAYWGTSQAAFSLAAVAGGHHVGLLPDTHNFPLHLLHMMTTPVPAQLVHLHYHWLFSPEEETTPVLRKLGLSDVAISWLADRLRLRSS